MGPPQLPWSTTSIRARLLCSTTLAVILILTWTGFTALKNSSEVTGQTEAVGNAATAESLDIITATEPRDQNVTWNTFAEVTDGWDKTVTPTSFGPIILVDAPHSESGSQTTEPKTTVVSLNPEDGSIRWIRTLFPGADSFSIQDFPRGPHPRNTPFSALYESSTLTADISLFDLNPLAISSPSSYSPQKAERLSELSQSMTPSKYSGGH